MKKSVAAPAMKARPTMAMAELVSTFEISPRLARPMKMTPRTASRMGAILLAKKVTTPSVSSPSSPASDAGLEQAWRDLRIRCDAIDAALVDHHREWRLLGE